MNASRRDAWSAKLRWFAAEYLIVVVGVLTAFALSAWWQSRQDRDRETSYLHQLASELAATVALMNEADSASIPWERTHARITQAFYADSVTPGDSIYDRIGQSIVQPNMPTPVLGTAKALSSTGDLRLIENEGLRFEISTYVEVSELEAEKQLRYFDMFFAAVQGLAESLSPARLHTAYHPHFDFGSPAGVGSRAWFPEDLRGDRFSPTSEQLLGDRQLLGSVVAIANAHENARPFRDDHRKRARELLSQVDGEIAR
jgi:hypothetical protein